MPMDRQHPAPQAHLPASPVTTSLPAATMSYPGAVDMTVCEWTTDLSVTPLLGASPTQTAAGAAGYIDFDSIDTVREVTRSVASARS